MERLCRVRDWRRSSRDLNELAHDATLRGWFTALKVAAVSVEQRPALVREAVRSLQRDHSTRRLFLQYLLEIATQKERALVQQAIRTELEGEKMYSMADALRASGYRRGKKQGLEAGIKSGLKTGMKKGLEKGQVRGLRVAVEEVLRSRFKSVSPELIKHLGATNSPERLRELLSRAVTIRRASQLLQTERGT